MKIIIACQCAAVLLIFAVAAIMTAEGDYITAATAFLVGITSVALLIAEARFRRN
jgi:hypothetical protein